MPPTLQPVRSPAEAARTAALAAAIWRAHYTPIIGAAQVDYMLDRFQSAAAIAAQVAAGARYWLAVADGADVGYVAVEDRPDGLFLSKLYVAAAARGRGLARTMLAHALADARVHGHRRLWLTVNRHNDGAIAAYERLGFVRTGPVITDIGGGFVMDDWRYDRDVKP